MMKYTSFECSLSRSSVQGLRRVMGEASRDSHERLTRHVDGWLAQQEDIVKESFQQYMVSKKTSKVVAFMESLLDWVLWAYKIAAPMLVLGRLASGCSSSGCSSSGSSGSEEPNHKVQTEQRSGVERGDDDTHIFTGAMKVGTRRAGEHESIRWNEAAEAHTKHESRDTGRERGTLYSIVRTETPQQRFECKNRSIRPSSPSIGTPTLKIAEK
jgi:hypothetical protein